MSHLMYLHYGNKIVLPISIRYEINVKFAVYVCVIDWLLLLAIYPNPYRIWAERSTEHLCLTMCLCRYVLLLNKNKCVTFLIHCISDLIIIIIAITTTKATKLKFNQTKLQIVKQRENKDIDRDDLQ